MPVRELFGIVKRYRRGTEERKERTNILKNDVKTKTKFKC